MNGHPKPTITWTKDNNSDLLQSNLRAKVITDNEKGHSQLVITGLESGDYGKYWCVARNNVGVRTSRVAFLSPGTSGETWYFLYIQRQVKAIFLSSSTDRIKPNRSSLQVLL